MTEHSSSSTGQGVPTETAPTSLQPDFDTDVARRIWDDYIDRVDSVLSPLRASAREELVREIKAHLLESIREDSGHEEAERVLNATEKLGRPEEYLEPIVTNRMIEEGSTTYNPIWILKGLGRTLLRGAKATVLGLGFGIGYLIALTITSLAVLKPIFPDHVGLFYAPGEGLRRLAFGFLNDPSARTEVLGYWVIPISLGIGVLLYVALTKMLGALQHSD